MVSERYEVGFLERESCGTEVASFRFSKPEGYSFVPGQHMVLRLETAEGPQSKPFTHSQAPRDGYLEVTTRLSGSAFKNALAVLEPGERVTVLGPLGGLVLPPRTTRIAFLVGGVGITPARSMLRDAWQNGRIWEDAVVFYGNRDPSCMPFAAELAEMTSTGVRVVHVIEHPDDGWEGYTGFVTARIVAENMDASDGRTFCVSGPPVMVDAMERVLDELGVEPGRRLIERFGTTK